MKKYFISTDKKLIDTQKVLHLLQNCFWSQGIPIEYVRRMIEYSLCFAVYNEDEELIGFSRVISDYTTYAYICDVVIAAEHRHQAIGELLVDAILKHKELRGLKTWSLRTTEEARKIYESAGFKSATDTDNILEIEDLDIYKKENFINLFKAGQ
jgi:ribosomal protein S18 acetylase RimI-like enzyme